MTFRGQIDVLVHFESFRNVDLYHQGMYFLKSTLYHKQEQKVRKKLSPVLTANILSLI